MNLLLTCQWSWVMSDEAENELGWFMGRVHEKDSGWWELGSIHMDMVGLGALQSCILHKICKNPIFQLCRFLNCYILVKAYQLQKFGYPT